MACAYGCGGREGGLCGGAAREREGGGGLSGSECAGGGGGGGESGKGKVVNGWFPKELRSDMWDRCIRRRAGRGSSSELLTECS